MGIGTSMTCDFPMCGNIISARCNICGWSFCTRHIEWIPSRDIGGLYPVYSSAYYRCDLCAQIRGKPKIAASYIWNGIGNYFNLQQLPIEALNPMISRLL